MNDDLKNQLTQQDPNDAGDLPAGRQGEGVSVDSQQTEGIEQVQADEPEVTSGDPGLSEENSNASTEPVAEEKTDDADEKEDETLSTDDQKIMESDSQVDADEKILPDTDDALIIDENAPRWYVVHTYSGHENRVAASLKQRIESEHLETKIVEVLVPTQDKIEIKSGKKETIKEKIFPGYILVKMVLDDASWLAVRTTQGVTSFVGMGNKPTPIPEHEVKSIVSFMTQGAQPTYKSVFIEGDTVKIVDGPFAEFIGKVDSVDKDRGKVRVLVSIFGRETPVELDFLQVNKL